MPAADPDFAQRVVLDALLEAHPRLIAIPDLQAHVGDVADVAGAVRQLADDGLVSRLGDLVGASRAAVRFAALGL